MSHKRIQNCLLSYRKVYWVVVNKSYCKFCCIYWDDVNKKKPTIFKSTVLIYLVGVRTKFAICYIVIFVFTTRPKKVWQVDVNIKLNNMMYIKFCIFIPSANIWNIGITKHGDFMLKVQYIQRINLIIRDLNMIAVYVFRETVYAHVKTY